MAYVYHCGPTNSTAFTRCCSVAICAGQKRCPSCKSFVYPYDDSMTDRERDEISPHRAGLMRFNYAHKRS